MEEREQKLRDIQRQYVDFLDDGNADGVYEQRVNEMIGNEKYRLIVNINDVRNKLPERAKLLLDESFDELIAFQRALKEFVGSMNSDYAKSIKEFLVGFEGSFGNRHLTARSLSSRHLNNLVCIEGIITKVSLVRPKVITSVHYCPTTSKTMERNYSDLTSLEAYPTSAAYPTTDEDGNLLQTEYGLSTYKNHQTLTVQELPEKAPTGQLPRSVDIICEHDLVDVVKPGDRVQIIGTYRALPNKQAGFTSGSFRTILLANNIILPNSESGPSISADDVAKCKKLRKQKKNEIFSLLARSLAPSIHGHEFVKKALLCMLLGGVEKNLPNGSRIRGDINILLIGDPSVAKSQLLRYVLSTAACSIATTGRGSSGVGLTAAVTTDQETGERQLEAGAMVLADRGIVCIDEFDKMSDMDRTAIHEVMEQGRVTISKAGIHARLNARCSVLAAANPVYGRYDPHKTPMENIGLQDSLLSRFDLLFILLDTVDVESDRRISDHVLRVHRYRSPDEADGAVSRIGAEADNLTTDKDQKETGDAGIWDKNEASGKGKGKLLSIDFVQKYIEVAKYISPVLTEEAAAIIGEEYSALRSKDWESQDIARTQAVTARALETLIRLSTAHAKSRLSKTIEREDAEAAIELVQFAYFKKVLGKSKKKRHQEDDSDEDASEDEEQPQTKKPKTEETQDSEAVDSEPVDSEPMDTATPRDISDEELKAFRKVLNEAFAEKHQSNLELSYVMQFVKDKIENVERVNDDFIMACINKMSDANQVMLSSGTLYLI